jgi:hypothetical protein
LCVDSDADSNTNDIWVRGDALVVHGGGERDDGGCETLPSSAHIRVADIHMQIRWIVRQSWDTRCADIGPSAKLVRIRPLFVVTLKSSTGTRSQQFGARFSQLQAHEATPPRLCRPPSTRAPQWLAPVHAATLSEYCTILFSSYRPVTCDPKVRKSVFVLGLGKP